MLDHDANDYGSIRFPQAFTKKAVKAAKAGIATLEHALENLDQGQQQQQGAGAGAARGGSGRSG